jgi:hypothetical protein
MGNSDDFICALLLPLAGSTTDELSEEENERLPIDLQYLPNTKQRESDRDIQHILLETILLVCFKRYLSFFSNIYLINIVMCNKTNS